MDRRGFLACLVLVGCSRTPKTQKPLVGWRPIVSFSGRGASQTESFNIESGQWRIKWETTNESAPGAGSFRLTVHSAVSGRPLMQVVDHRGAGKDVAYVNEDPRLYHLVIDSADVDWSVKIEEAVV